MTGRSGDVTRCHVACSRTSQPTRGSNDDGELQSSDPRTSKLRSQQTPIAFLTTPILRSTSTCWQGTKSHGEGLQGGAADFRIQAIASHQSHAVAQRFPRGCCMRVRAAMRVPWRVRILAFDTALQCAAILVALFLRDNLTFDPQKLEDAFPYTCFVAALAVPISIGLGIDRTVWRFTAAPDYIRILTSVGFTIVGATVATFLFNRSDGLSRSVPILQLLLAVSGLVGSRLIARMWFRNEGQPWPSASPIESSMRRVGPDRRGEQDRGHPPSRHRGTRFRRDARGGTDRIGARRVGTKTIRPPRLRC